MTSTDYPAVKNVFDMLKNSYNALGLRALITKERQNWICLFCIIRATIDDDKFVKSIHDDKRSKIKFKEPAGCKIAFESTKINDMDIIFQEMKNGYITIAVLSVK